MTGMACKHDKECKFYRATYGSVFNNPVINPYGDKFTCDVLDWFKKEVGEGPARLTRTSLQKLKKVPLECIALEKLNKNKI